MTRPAREAWRTCDPPGPPGSLPRHWPHESAQSFGPYDSTAPTVRLYARVVLAEWGMADLAPTAELVLSELVTNALQITWQLRLDTPVGVRLLADSCWLVLEVWDGAHEVPRMQAPDLAAEFDGGDESDGHGNGLMIVATMCHQWGHLHCPEGGKIVYAILAR
jgi:anti-sigma regulatory factor (Ser/Thr protein kinase)